MASLLAKRWRCASGTADSVMRISELIEAATAGSTASANIGTVVSPHIAIGTPGKSYTGSPGKSGTRAPKSPKVRMQKPSDNALDSNTNIFGSGNAIKR